MAGTPDYYDVLRVGRGATRQEISRAYRALMRSHHPDLDAGAHNGSAHSGSADDDGTRDGELLLIMEAFSVLGDAHRRAAYDRQHAAPHTIPVRKAPPGPRIPGDTIRVTPVRWESGPWA
jgi:DnaJ-class molecular chaperone